MVVETRCGKGGNHFFGVVPDFLLVDASRAALYSAFGCGRRPYGSRETWPHVRDLFSEYSEHVLSASGQEVWEANGGFIDGEGICTCRVDSQMAGRAVKHAAERSGGVRWSDGNGTEWVVRLIGPHRDDVCFGFGVEAPAATSFPRFGTFTQPYLWALHFAAMTQRSEVVVLPDIQFAQIAWGGNRNEWPKDWRSEVWTHLVSLTRLHTSVLRLAGEGFVPRFASHSVAVASVEDLSHLPGTCGGCCPQCRGWSSGIRHSHFRIQLGLGFLGVLNEVVTKPPDGPHDATDNRHEGGSTRRNALKRARAEAKLVTVHGPAAVFGLGPRAKTSETEVKILNALIREVTRATARASSRRDRALVTEGNLVPGVRLPSRVPCPLLDERKRWITFGGNGRRPGMGYGIIGGRGTGWLFKCGIIVPDDPAHRRRLVTKFLTSLKSWHESLGFVAAGLDSRSGRWSDLDALIAMADQRLPSSTIDDVQLRVYAPEDYLPRCRRLYADAAGLRSIPGEAPESNDAGPPPTAVPGMNDLVILARRLGVSNKQLAQELNVSPSFVSQMLHGHRPWPQRLKQAAQRFLAGVVRAPSDPRLAALG